MSNDQEVADIKYLIEQLAPATDPAMVVPGLSSMFYATSSFEGDLVLISRIKEMCDRYDIDIEESNE